MANERIQAILTALQNVLDTISGKQDKLYDSGANQNFKKINGQSLFGSGNITTASKTSDLTNDSDFVSDDDYVHTDNNYTTAEKNKLDGIDMSAKQDKGKMTVGSMEYTVARKALTVYDNGTPTTYYLADLTTEVTANGD